MAKHTVRIEQLIRQTINAEVEADDEETALVAAENSENWTTWDADNDEVVIENRAIEALALDAQE